MSERERSVDEAITAYFQEAEAGRPPERVAFLARFPEIAAELTSFLDDRAAFERRAGGPAIDCVTDSPAATPTLGADEAPAALSMVRYFGDYELLKEIARGGMGVVYRARQVSLNRIVALKMILSGDLASAADVQRFRAEAEAAANLDHPNIVPIYEVGEHDGRPYFSMKLIEGGSLAEEVARRDAEGAEKKLISSLRSPRLCAQLLATVVRAVHHAHQRGILHRDLKPGNILLDRNGQPHVTDFGLAKRVEGDSRITQTGAIVGTPAYMAPEQARADKGLTTAADVYALGAILYECLTGRPPFRGGTPLETILQVLDREPDRPSAVKPGVDRDLETICLKCLEKEPARRYESAAALADDLDRWSAGEAIHARRIGLGERVLKWARRRPAIAALTALLFLSMTLGQVGVLVAWRQADLARQHAEQERADKDAALTRVEAERQEKDEARIRAEGLRLTAESAVALPTDPALALLLAIEAAGRGPRRAAHNNALFAALTACREEGPLLRHEYVRSAAFFPDGRRVLSVSGSRTNVWDAGRVLTTLKQPPQIAMLTADLSPDGRRVVCVFDRHFTVTHPPSLRGVYTGCAARVCDTETGNEVAILRGHEHQIASTCFSPDGKQILTASWDGTARLWDSATGKERLVFRGHDCALQSARFCADGQRVLTVSSGQVHSPFSAAQEGQKRGLAIDPPVRPDGTESVQSGDASYGASSSHKGEDVFACLWDVRTGEKVVSFQAPSKRELIFPTTVAATADGRRLFVASRKSLAVWDADTGKELVSLEDGPLLHQVTGATFSPDGKRLATRTRYDPSPQLWDVAMGKELARLRGHEEEITSVGFSPNGLRVVTTSKDRTTRLWDAATGKEEFCLRGHEMEVRTAAFSPDGKRLTTASVDGTVRFWDVAPGVRYGRAFEDRKRVWSAAMSPDGRRVATGSFDGTVRLWDAVNGQEQFARKGLETVTLAGVREELLGEVVTLAFSPDGTRLLSVSADREGTLEPDAPGGKSWPLPYTPVRIWDVQTGRELVALAGHTETVRTALYSPDGQRILTLPHDRGRDRRKFTSLGQPRQRGSGGGSDQLARIFDAATGREVCLLRGDWRTLTGGGWSADGRKVCTAHDSTRARVWDAATGKELTSLDGKHERNIVEVAFSPDGRHLLTWNEQSRKGSYTVGTQSGAADVWDAQTGKHLFAFKGHTAQVNSATYSPDGRVVVTTAEQASSHTSSAPLGLDGRHEDKDNRDRTARIWEAQTGRELHVLHGHERSVHSATFSADGRRVVTTSEDRTARVWDVATGRELFTLRGHTDALRSAVFSPDGESVLTASWDGTARLWPLDPLPLAQARKPRELTARERALYELPEPVPQGGRE